jgi:hypothetical protein
MTVEKHDFSVFLHAEAQRRPERGVFSGREKTAKSAEFAKIIH